MLERTEIQSGALTDIVKEQLEAGPLDARPQSLHADIRYDETGLIHYGTRYQVRTVEIAQAKMRFQYIYRESGLLQATVNVYRLGGNEKIYYRRSFTQYEDGRLASLTRTDFSFSAAPALGQVIADNREAQRVLAILQDPVKLASSVL